MYDYDVWAQEDISMQRGGAEEEDLITGISDFIQEGKAEVSCPLLPKQTAGIRIKTYRRKAGLRSVNSSHISSSSRFSSTFFRYELTLFCKYMFQNIQLCNYTMISKLYFQ
jgi:hypothetical protein